MSFSVYKLKDHLKKNPHDKQWDVPIESDRWKNIIFLKDGRSFMTRPCFASEQEAKQTLDAERPRSADTFFCIILINGVSPFFEWNAYSHAIQVPWKER